MKNKETILKDWNKNGYVNIPFFTEEEISDIRKEGKRLLVERNPDWENTDLKVHNHTDYHIQNRLYLKN